MQKIWIYTLSKQLSAEQEADFKNRCLLFVNSWTAHDTSLDASFELYNHRLLIFNVDETKYAASGCSIDKQVRLVKELEQQFSIELLNRLLVVKASEIKQLLENGLIAKDTLVFDNTITSSEELKTSWKRPLQETYLAKYLMPA